MSAPERPQAGPSRRPSHGLAMALIVMVAAHAVAAVERIVRYEEDRLSVRLTEVPIAEVIEEVGRQARASIRGAARTDLVSASFDRVPLDEALRRLLGDENFTLRYGETGLREIELLGDGAAGAAGGRGSTRPGLVRTALILGRAVTGYAPVRVFGRAAKALGSTEASMPEIIRAALHDEDPQVRSDALDTALAAIDDDAELRAAVLRVADTIGDRKLAKLLHLAPDGFGERFLDYVGAQVENAEIHAKATSLRRELRRHAGRGDDRR